MNGSEEGGSGGVLGMRVVAGRAHRLPGALARSSVCMRSSVRGCDSGERVRWCNMHVGLRETHAGEPWRAYTQPARSSCTTCWATAEHMPRAVPSSASHCTCTAPGSQPLPLAPTPLATPLTMMLCRPARLPLHVAEPRRKVEPLRRQPGLCAPPPPCSPPGGRAVASNKRYARDLQLPLGVGAGACAAASSAVRAGHGAMGRVQCCC